MNKSEFEKLLFANQNIIERYIYYKTKSKSDGDDVIQETFLAAYKQFEKINDKSKFKSWLLGIAKHKCADYYRRDYKADIISIDSIDEISYSGGLKTGIQFDVHYTLESMDKNQKEILWLYYFENMSVNEIAKQLNLPIGTIKSRLFSARQQFKKTYSHCTKSDLNQGGSNMQKFPEYAPEIKITRLNAEPFEVECIQELGYFCSPVIGEKVQHARYELDENGKMALSDIVTGWAENTIIISGIECVEIKYDFKNVLISHAQRINGEYLQDLAGIIKRKSDGQVKITTFLDDDFYNCWGFGENNCGEEILKKSRGIITENSDGTVLTTEKVLPHNQDICGRYQITINGKTYDTIRSVYFCPLGEMAENYIDRNGKNIYFKYYSTKIDNPENKEKVVINGENYYFQRCAIPDYAM
ncbi:MAG: RNA polymerase sigma factor [Oscillospiraceae bacterium]